MSIKDLFFYSRDRTEKGFSLEKEELSPGKADETGKKVSEKLSENLSLTNRIFAPDENFDFVLRKFSIPCINGEKEGFLIFYDGLSNAEYISRDILGGLLRPAERLKMEEITSDTVFSRIITQAPLSKETSFDAITEAVGFGNCGIFVEGCKEAFVADVKGFGGRDVGVPVTEAVLSGPQEGFCEKLMVNIGLVRKILKIPNLICEKITLGEKSRTPCSLMYINGLTNTSLLEEARRRLSKIETEYIFSTSEVEMFIEDSTLFPLPQLLKTERPDRAASYLSEGKAVLLVQGSPFALIIPAVLPDLLKSAEDGYVRAEEANFMKLVRIFGVLTALFLPAVFISVSLYHHGSIPSDLLFGMAAGGQAVPFSAAEELLIMVFSFELIKEASVRIPSPIGSTLGIVGGLILGQAAVSAGLVSPILIIVVSLSGLGAFAVPSVSLMRAVSVMSVVFIILGAAAGFFGLCCGLCVCLSALFSRTSFGVPYFPSGLEEFFGEWFVFPVWKREKRPKSLKTKENRKQPKISRKWILK